MYPGAGVLFINIKGTNLSICILGQLVFCSEYNPVDQPKEGFIYYGKTALICHNWECPFYGGLAGLAD